MGMPLILRKDKQDLCPPDIAGTGIGRTAYFILKRGFIIQSVTSRKVDPLRVWLAKTERVILFDNVVVGSKDKREKERKYVVDCNNDRSNCCD